jgi:hypothetical protein
MKELKFVVCQPDDNYYVWQVHLWIESLRKIGMSDKAIVLVFTPSFRDKASARWEKVVNLYPEAEFVFYKDEENDISDKIGVYIPVLRPYCLQRYFKDNPDMKNNAVFYCDSDIVFTEKFDVSKFIDDDVCYLSDTNSYVNASYFDSKIKDVLPNKLEEYKKHDILGNATSLVGIDRATCEKNNLHSGGAQYFLKNIDASFWEDVKNHCLYLRVYLQNVNKEFFKDEDTGFQSWCADMWAVLWNLWKRDLETKNVPEMEFAWSSDPIEKLSRCTILHNAGIVGDYMKGYPAFYKGKYHTGKNPFNDSHLNIVLNSEESAKYCTHHYVIQLIELKNKYNLTYNP